MEESGYSCGNYPPLRVAPSGARTIMQYMSTQILAVIINLLSVGLPLLGINLGNDALTTTVQTLVAFGTGLWIWYRRTTLQKAPEGEGDVTAGGIRK